MTAATLAHLPLQVGGVALAQAGRVALWVVQRYMRAPLTNSAIAALVVTSAMAGSNALYGQRHAHPAPLFAPVENVTTGSIDSELVIPKTRPKTFSVSAPARIAAVDDTPAPTSSGEPVGNKDVFEIQRKLEQMQLFSGTVDGYYGPRTAQAIRKFEEQSGLKPTGELTRETIGLILAAPLAAKPTQQVAPIVAPKAEPEAETLPAITLPKAQAAPVEQDLAPAKAQQPLAANVKPLVPNTTTNLKAASKSTTAKLLGRPVPATPEQALEMAADTAGDAINTIIDGVQTVAMNAPPKQQFARASTAEATAPVALVPNSVTAKAQEVAALPDNPQVGVPLKIEEEAPKPGDTIAVLDTDATPDEVQPVSVTDPVVVAKVQRGLASLGFLHGPADGVAGEATAKAIRNFEVYFNYKVTGRITPELLDLLVDSGAVI